MNSLNWEVFVTPGIPIITRDRPVGVRETFFQAMASTLIYGNKDAVLVDAYLTTKQANCLADWVAFQRQESNNHLHYPRSWRPLVWSWHTSRSIPERQSS